MPMNHEIASAMENTLILSGDFSYREVMKIYSMPRMSNLAPRGVRVMLVVFMEFPFKCFSFGLQLIGYLLWNPESIPHTIIFNNSCIQSW